MKIKEVKCINFLKYILNNKGMVMLEFIMVIVWVVFIAGIFIEVGYMLKSEAIVMGATRNAVRQANSRGVFDDEIRDNIINKLNQSNIEVTKVGFEIQNKFFYDIPLEDSFEIPIGFRQDYQIIVYGSHELKAINFSNTNYPIQIPVVFALNGRGELWTTDSLREYKDPLGTQWLITN